MRGKQTIPINQSLNLFVDLAEFAGNLMNLLNLLNFFRSLNVELVDLLNLLSG
jgi:hypothetical protein